MKLTASQMTATQNTTISNGMTTHHPELSFHHITALSSRVYALIAGAPPAGS
jgi:hypothetical protein